MTSGPRQGFRELQAAAASVSPRKTADWGWGHVPSEHTLDEIAALVPRGLRAPPPQFLPCSPTLSSSPGRCPCATAGGASSYFWWHPLGLVDVLLRRVRAPARQERDTECVSGPSPGSTADTGLSSSGQHFPSGEQCPVPGIPQVVKGFCRCQHHDTMASRAHRFFPFPSQPFARLGDTTVPRWGSTEKQAPRSSWENPGCSSCWVIMGVELEVRRGG